MTREPSEEEVNRAFNIGGPIPPLRVPVEEAAGHPLLRHAVDDKWGYVSWPSFTERQKLVAHKAVNRIRVDGRMVYSMPPRVNADWFLPSNPTPDDVRTMFGRVADLQRWYLVINPVPHPSEVTLITALTTDGERKFFRRAHRDGWAPMPAHLFVDMRDNPELVIAPTDKIVADAWEQVWKVRSGG
jgi:hypothetical protein